MTDDERMLWRAIDHCVYPEYGEAQDALNRTLARADRFEKALKIILHASWEAPEDWANIHRVAREALDTNA